MKIAYFSPLNPVKTGVSDYSEELLEYLAGYARIDLFVDDYEPSTNWLHDEFEIRNFKDINDERLRRTYDVLLYHMGNNDHHSYIYPILLDFPGVTVLHEPMLHHFIFSQTVGRERLRDYIRELDYCHKSGRREIVKNTLEQRDENSWYDYPLIDRMVDASQGIIVHSDFAKEQVLSVNEKAAVREINHHYALPPKDLPSPRKIRERLGFSPEDFVIGSLGFITEHKRMDLVFKTLAQLRDQGVPVKFLLVGEALPGCDPERWTAEHSLEDCVVFTGFVDPRTFREYLMAPDIFIALRYPSAGETSGSVIKMMGAGAPVVLTNHYAFREFPDDSCIKIDPGPEEEKDLFEKLLYYYREPGSRIELGQNAKKYIRVEHNVEKSAREYIEFIQSTLTSL